jgi:hypothetical protein
VGVSLSSDADYFWFGVYFDNYDVYRVVLSCMMLRPLVNCFGDEQSSGDIWYTMKSF